MVQPFTGNIPVVKDRLHMGKNEIAMHLNTLFITFTLSSFTPFDFLLFRLLTTFISSLCVTAARNMEFSLLFCIESHTCKLPGGLCILSARQGPAFTKNELKPFAISIFTHHLSITHKLIGKICTNF